MSHGPSAGLGAPREEEGLTIARNLSTRYIAIGVEMVVGLVVLPFNLAHLGAPAYGLWMLAAGVTTYFTMFNLGFNAAVVKYVAHYRARRDATALNQVVSTTFFIFAGLAVVAYLVALLVAANLGALFTIAPEQLALGRFVLLVISLQVAGGLAFAVFGGVINGFQRYDLNNVVAAVSTLVVAIVNVAVLLAGYGLAELVVATTAVRLLTLWVYRANAYRVFPALSVRLSLMRQARLREIAPFSAHMFVIDWAHKINFSLDVLVIGAFLNTTAVAVWAVAQRLAEAMQRMSNQLSDVLFPTVVDHDSAQNTERLQKILLFGTRLSLAISIAIGGTLMLTAEPLIHAWVGAEFADSVPVLQLLALTVIIRVAAATPATVLKGSGGHRLLSITNVTAAAANLGLSLLLVQRLGLLGVALGTLLPITIASLLVTFPAGCRRVALPLGRAWREAVWPAVWPAAVLAAFVLATAGLFGRSLVGVGAQMTLAALLYAATFAAFALSANERRLFTSRLRQLLRQPRRPAPVAAVSEGA